MKISQAKIDARLSELTKQRVERKEREDLPGSMTLREQNAYCHETTAIDQRLAAIRSAAFAYAESSTVEADVAWRDFLDHALQSLSADRAEITSPIRDREQQLRADRLDFSIKLIKNGLGGWKLPVLDVSHLPLGALMQQAGYPVLGEALHREWRGSLPEVEARIKRQAAARESAERALEAVLMTDEEQKKQDAEQRAFADVMSSMVVTLNADGAGVSAFTKDGDPLPFSEMTLAQQDAFARFSKAACPPRPEATR